MIDYIDFIIKKYVSKSGRNKSQKWFMHYCDICKNKRSYRPQQKSVGSLCCKCASRNRVISEEQKEKISKTLAGNKNYRGHTKESRSLAVKKSWITRNNATSEQKFLFKIRAGAIKMGISTEEYIKIQKDIQIKRKIAHNMRSQIGNLIRGHIGKIRHVNWTIDDLKYHLESKWTIGMSWDNYGRKRGIRCWEIDHIIPIRAKNESGDYLWKNIDDPLSKDFKKCFDLSNLQPLWADLNNAKNNKYEE